MEGSHSLVECTGLENRRSARVRGFESHPLRHVLLVGPIMNRLIQSDTLANTCFTVRVGVSNRFECVAQIWLRGDGIKSRYSVGNPNPTAHSHNNLASLCQSSKLKLQDF